MSRRTLVLSAIAVVLLAAGLEFGVASPYYGRLRVAFENYQLHSLRTKWRPPCDSNDWSYVELDGITVPVPGCFQYERYAVEGTGQFLIAYDRNSADTVLTISASTVPEDRTDNMRAGAHRAACSITLDDTVLMWECFDNVHVLIGDKWLSSSLQTPGYLPHDVRERETRIAIEIGKEFIRLQDNGPAPAGSHSS